MSRRPPVMQFQCEGDWFNCRWSNRADPSEARRRPQGSDADVPRHELRLRNAPEAHGGNATPKSAGQRTALRPL